ncbi:MAG: 3-dehydroquinate synthase, partial [Planctomycetota bacterium]
MKELSLPTSLETVPVGLGERRYDIVIGAGQLQSPELLTKAAATSGVSDRALVLSDANLAAGRFPGLVADAFAEAGFACANHRVTAGETAKSLDTLAGVYDALVDMKADRNSLVIAVGGGVVGDLAGFAAATYNRGVPFLQVPTTLLAMVDSSVGGKTGINHPRGKNLIGAFHQPIGVVIDTDTLATLPERDYRSGLAEVVKYGVIADEDFFAWLEANADALVARDDAALRHVIATSCRIKAQVVEEDEFETSGRRAILNYGHTFAHAYEALAGYGVLTHGEAVAIGMLDASRLAERLGMIDAAATERQFALLTRLGLPTTRPEGFDPTPE